MTDLPNWVFFVGIAVVYITGHLRGLPSKPEKQIAGKWRMPIRIFSTLLLIIALLTVIENKDNTAFVLLFAALAFASGYLNGRAMDMEKIRGLRGKQQTAESPKARTPKVDIPTKESPQG
jgi:hypothetical protein